MCCAIDIRLACLDLYYHLLALCFQLYPRAHNPDFKTLYPALLR
jgi:hypothetical protein